MKKFLKTGCCVCIMPVVPTAQTKHLPSLNALLRFSPIGRKASMVACGDSGASSSGASMRSACRTKVTVSPMYSLAPSGSVRKRPSASSISAHTGENEVSLKELKQLEERREEMIGYGKRHEDAGAVVGG